MPALCLSSQSRWSGAMLVMGTGFGVGVLAALLATLVREPFGPGILANIFFPNLLFLGLAGGLSFLAHTIARSLNITVFWYFPVAVTLLSLLVMAGYFWVWYTPQSGSEIIFYIVFFRQIFLFPFMLLGALEVGDHLFRNELTCRHCAFYISIAAGLQLLTLYFLA